MGQVMAAPQISLLAVGLLLVLILHCSSFSPPCPQPCTCQRAQLLNCSSSGLSSVPRLTQDSVAELDLSHNLLNSVTLRQPHQSLKNLWLGDNSITYLSLCMERNPKDQFLRGRPRTGSRARCLTWAPTLQLLSAENNLLEQLPKGLDGVESLQVLRLSFNRISTLQPGVLSHLRQLKELHLQHNLLIHLHPQTFQNLDQLRVLDLSFNMLTSLHPVTYLTLYSTGMDVRLGGNRWQCDCSMHSLRRRMAYDHSRGLQNWNIVCSSPSTISGRDLLQLEEEELNCLNTENRSELHQDVTVYSGSEILLPCSAQDWWTPRGQASVSQHNAGLLIRSVSERDTGLYVCVSEEDQIVSVFNLQISKPGGARKPRSLSRAELSLPQATRNRIVEKINQNTTQSQLALAVCLSVFITFLLAFVLGVLARPCIDVLWKKITNTKSTSAANSTSTGEQEQYVNEAFYSAEEPEDPEPRRERRVTFSTVDFAEETNVQYFDTVVIGDQDSNSNDAVFEDQVVRAELYKQTNRESGSEHLLLTGSEDKKSDDSHSGDSNECRIHNKEFEPILEPDDLGERRSLSSCSDSSLSGKVSGEEQITKRKHTKSKSPQLVEDSLQQRLNLFSKAEVTQMSIEGKTEILKLSSRSVDDCSLHSYITNPVDSDDLHDNGELFDFSDSAQSPTTGSSNVFDSFNNLKPSSDQQKMEDMSSSSSYVSENEPTHYTVNSDPETEPDNSNGVQIQRVDPVKHNYDTKRPAERPHYSFSSDSSESDKESMQNKRKITYKKGTTDLKAEHHRSRLKDWSDVRAQALPSDFSSSDESTNDEINDTQKERRTGWTRVQTSQSVSPDSSTQWPLIDLRHVPSIKRRLDIKATSPAFDLTFNNTDAENKTTCHMNTQVQEDIYLSNCPIKKSRNTAKEILASSDTSSSSDSEDETIHQFQKQVQEELHVSKPPIKVSQTVTNEPKGQWPVIDLGGVTRIKRRLDIKGPSPSHDYYTSSESEDETGHIKKQEQQELNTTRPPINVSQTVTKEPENKWPALNLERVTRIKRRLDIKGPSPSRDSSTSSESEDETGHIKKQEQQELNTTRPPINVSQTVTKEPENKWPALNLERVTRIKRRLDIKGPSPSHDSSTSSESEDETGHIKKQEQQELNTTRPPINVSQTVTKEPENKWPALNLERVTRIKRRLDIKGPSPSHDSSTSSESEDETGHIKKQEQQELNTTRPPINVSQTVTKEPENKWPALNLERVTRIKRRLDIKGPSPSHDSSTSSESEDETGHIKKQEQQELNTTRPPINVSQTVTKEPENKWPALNLERVTRIKRRLDIKGPSPSRDSSTSSESEDETGHIKKQEQQELNTTRPPINVSQTVTKEPENKWPALNLERVTRIKRRLDIKGPSPSHDSSTSSESEDETGHLKKQEQQELNTTRPPINVSQTVTKEPENKWPALNLERVTRIKRRLDIKGPSPSHDYYTSSESEDETGHIKKQEQQELNTTRPPINVSQTVTKEPENKWPALNLERVTRIKRRLDIKGPSPSHDSSTSSESEDETGHIKKQEQQELNTTRPPINVSQTVTKEPENKWPALNLERVTRIKRRLDIKGPSPSHDFSTSSESEDETGHLKKQEQQELNTTRPPINVSQTVTKEPENKWPALNLERVTRIKRRLDIKGPSPSRDSSTSSESEDETGHIKKQEQQELNTTRPPINVSQTVTKEPENKWPALNLERVTRIKRRLDIKGPSPSRDSSTSSESEDETGHIKKQEQQELNTTRPPINVSQTVTKEPENKWPALNLERVTRIKRRLDIKGPSPSRDSSTSSESEDETGHIKKQEQQELNTTRPPINVSQTVTKEPENKWPALNLERVTRIKRRLDIKGPSPSHDSSTSSESEDETGHLKKQEQQELNTTRPPINVSQTVTKEPENKWPALNLERVTRIKRRLDIKGPSPSHDYYTSSESEDETGHIKKQEQQELNTTRPPINVSQTVTKEPENKWPALNLERVTRIKRRLDIKGPSPSHDSSTSSESEDETGHLKKQEQQELNTTRPPINVSQTVTKEPENKWPALNLERVTRIKRRLDIKGPSPSHDYYTSSESEDETGHLKKQEQQELNTTRPPINVSQTVTKEPENKWPALNLERVTRIKRRLDIKGPSPSHDSSTSSESEDETGHIKKQEQQELNTTRPPINVSQTVTKEPENKWPALNLERVTRIKRRLDIKGPSPSHDFSTSSESEDETGHIKKQEQQELNTTRPPINESQTVTKEPENKWPALNLERVTRIKRRLDIKGPSPSHDSSTSSESEDETGHLKKQEQQELNTTRPPINVSQTVTKEPENKWPALNLERVTRIKRRLDIKGPSPSHDSSTSSESEDETGHLKKQEQQELNTTRPPINVSQTVTKEPENKWPALNLERVTRIKRRLDIKGPSPSHDSSTSSESEDETGHIKKQEQQELNTTRPPINVSQTVTKEPENKWPALNLERVTRIKRRLDIKGPSPSHDSSTSSESEDETGHLKKQEQQELNTTRPPINVSQTVTKEPENKWPALNLERVTRIKRRLDIKGPSPSHDSSTSSESEDETGHLKKQEQQELNTTRPPINVSQTVTKEPENKWPALNLERVTRIKRRLDIKGPSPSHDSSTSSESEDETGHLKKQEQQELNTTRPPINVSQTVTKEPENKWPALNLERVTRIKRRLDIKGPSPSHDSSTSSESEDETGHLKKQEQQELNTTRPPINVSQTVTKEPENKWPALNLERVTRIKRRLDIKGPSPSHDSSTSSESEDETGHIKKQEQQELNTTRPPINESQTVTKEPENQWPAIVLERVTQNKRRLDIKGPPPRPDLSSSSDSEDDTGDIKTQEKIELHTTRLPINESQTVSKEPENKWPALNLEQVTRIKRRLDIKGSSTRFDSSSSSDNENEATSQIQKQVQELHLSRLSNKVSQTVTKEPENQWPAIVLERVTQIKRRLDIKGPPPRPDLSSSRHGEDDTGDIKIQGQQGLYITRPPINVSQTVTKDPENLWPALNLEQVTRIKRRLDIKGPSPSHDSSSSSDSEDEATGQFRKREQKVLNVSRPGLETSAVLTTSEKKFIQSPEVLVMNISHTPKKDHNIILEKYEVISDDPENQPTNNTVCSTPEITPELQTRWATMNLGISRFRRRLEITSPTTKSPNLPFSPPPNSPYSSSNENAPERQPRLQRIVGMQELVHTDSSCVPENIPENRSPTLKDPHNKVSFSSEIKPSVMEEEKTKADTILVDLSSQDIKRYQDIWVDEKTSATASQYHFHSSSSSESEDETTDPSVPDTSLSVPHIKKHLNIKAPSPEPSNTQSFFSQSEKDVTKYRGMQSRQTLNKFETTDESLITYKRSIIKTPSLPKNSFAPPGSGQTVDHTFIAQNVDSYRDASHAPRLGLSMSYDDNVKGKIRQSSSNTHVSLQHEIRWKGVGHHLSDLSTSNPVSMNATLPSLQQASLAEPHSLPLEASSSTNVIDKMQDGGKLDEILMNKYSSLDSEGASPSSSYTFDLLGISPYKTGETSKTASEDKKEKKGLDALKVMSLERRLWERDLSKDPSLSSDGPDSQDDNFIYSQFAKDTNISSKEPVKHIFSSSMEKKRDADLLLLYGIPRYIRHDIKAPMQDDPVPETPLPND